MYGSVGENPEVSLFDDPSALLRHIKLSTLLRRARFENADIGPVNALDEIDIFVISPPKCGTTALQRGFERLNRKVLHAHNDPTTYEALSNGNILRDEGITLGTMIRYRRALGRGPLHIFCGYRDPVSWYLSLAGHFSQPLDDALRNGLAQQISQAAPWVLYRFEDTRAAIEAGVGFDILQEPVDVERGYSLIRRGNVTVVLYRFDQLDNVADYIRQNIDPAFTLTRERVNQDEAYTQYVANFRLRRDVCESLFHGPIFSHFFSEDDRLRLIEKYSDDPGTETRSTLPPVRASGDAAVALTAILDSDEFKRNHPREALAAKAYGQLGRRPRIIDVGAQTLGPGSHVYDALMRYCEVEIIGFDPLQERLTEREVAEGGAHLTLLPYALGDGGTHTLYINNHDATSSLYPLNTEGNAPFPLLSQLHTVRTETLTTKRLDDVVPHQPVDFLKLDVQGGELMILEHAREVLKQTATVHCEVEFSPLYKGQPLFGDVSAFMVQQGFYFLDFTFLAPYTPENRLGYESNDRLIWADALFLRRDPSAEIKASQALSLALIYKKFALADYLLSSQS